MERSREKSNIPRPSTFNISSQDGRRAGRRVDWEIKQEDFQRGTRWLCSTPAAIRRRDGNLTEAVWCALVFSSTCAKCWKISTCWMTAKKIMESERAFFSSSCFMSALVWMTCTSLQETISKMIGIALYLRTVLRFPFLHCAWSVPLPAGNALIEAFSFSFFFQPLEVQKILSGSFYLTDCLFLFQYMNSARSLK